MICISEIRKKAPGDNARSLGGGVERDDDGELMVSAGLTSISRRPAMTV